MTGETLSLPLFVLPRGLLPECEEPLRIFEPRYKQMMDDCVLDDVPFGYCMVDVGSSRPQGWSEPLEYGCLAKAEDVREEGSNLLCTANGHGRFKIKKIIPAALDYENFGMIFPPVSDLEKRYQDDNPTGKLYLRAEIELIEPPTGNPSEVQWNELASVWAENVILFQNLVGQPSSSLEDTFGYIEEIFTQPFPDRFWHAGNMLLETDEERQKALSAETWDEIISLMHESLVHRRLKVEAMVKFAQTSLSSYEEE